MTLTLTHYSRAIIFLAAEKLGQLAKVVSLVSVHIAALLVTPADARLVILKREARVVKRGLDWDKVLLVDREGRKEGGHGIESEEE